MAHHAYPVGAAPVRAVDRRAYDAWVRECELATSQVARIGHGIHLMGFFKNADDVDAMIRDLRSANDLLGQVIELLDLNKEGDSE